MLCPEPDQRGRLVAIRDDPLARAQDKLARSDAAQARRSTAVDLGIPAFPDIAGRHGSAPVRP